LKATTENTPFRLQAATQIVQQDLICETTAQAYSSRARVIREFWVGAASVVPGIAVVVGHTKNEQFADGIPSTRDFILPCMHDRDGKKTLSLVDLQRRAEKPAVLQSSVHAPYKVGFYMITIIELFAIATSVTRIRNGLWLYTWVKAQPAGNKKLEDIGAYIQQGANTFLKREYSILSRFAGVIAILILLFIPTPI
jgi:hypothetical protein